MLVLERAFIAFLIDLIVFSHGECSLEIKVLFLRPLCLAPAHHSWIPRSNPPSTSYYTTVFNFFHNLTKDT